jgi:hypothetical protein
MSAEQHIESLASLLKTRLSSLNKRKIVDGDGRINYIESNIYDDSTIVNALLLSLSDFNQVPNFTSYTFDDARFVNRFASILVDGATLYCLSSQALIEKGREFTIVNDGIEIDPPCISDLMMEQYRLLYPVYWDKLKMIKVNLTRVGL